MKNSGDDMEGRVEQFIRRTSRVQDTPGMIQLLAGDAGMLAICRKLVNTTDPKQADLWQVFNAVCRRQKIDGKALKRKLVPAARSLGVVAADALQTDYYEILGVTSLATPDEIQSAYRRKAKKLHPDMQEAQSDQSFLSLSEAYHVLKDPELRRHYDENVKDLESWCEPPACSFADVRVPKVRPERRRYVFQLGAVIGVLIIAALVFSVVYEQREMQSGLYQSLERGVKTASATSADRPVKKAHADVRAPSGSALQTTSDKTDSQPVNHRDAAAVDEPEISESLSLSGKADSAPNPIVHQSQSPLPKAGHAAKSVAAPMPPEHFPSPSTGEPKQTKVPIVPVPAAGAATENAEMEALLKSMMAGKTETKPPGKMAQAPAKHESVRDGRQEALGRRDALAMLSEISHPNRDRGSTNRHAQARQQRLIKDEENKRQAEQEGLVLHADISHAARRRQPDEGQETLPVAKTPSDMVRIKAFVDAFRRTYESRNAADFSNFFASDAVDNGMPFSKLRYQRMFGLIKTIRYKIDVQHVTRRVGYQRVLADGNYQLSWLPYGGSWQQEKGRFYFDLMDTGEGFKVKRFRDEGGRSDG